MPLALRWNLSTFGSIERAGCLLSQTQPRRTYGDWGFGGVINIAPVGIEPFDMPAVQKNGELTFIYVGRLSPSKRVLDIVEALALFRRTVGGGHLLLIGQGPDRYIRAVIKRADDLGIAKYVSYLGWVDERAKHQHMAEAHALLMASVREGWGLVVTECNACGTPAVVYDVGGLRDSVQHLKTGLVVPPSPQDLAAGMTRLVGDPELYASLSAGALEWSKRFTHDASFRVVQDLFSAWTARS